MTDTTTHLQTDPLVCVKRFLQGAYNLGLSHKKGESFAIWSRHQSRCVTALLQELEIATAEDGRPALVVKKLTTHLPAAEKRDPGEEG